MRNFFDFLREKLLNDKIVAVGTRPDPEKTVAIREKIYEDSQIPLYLSNVRVISGQVSRKKAFL